MKKTLAILMALAIMLTGVAALAETSEVKVLLSDGGAYEYLDSIKDQFKEEYGYDLTLTLVANSSGASYDTAVETQVAAGTVDIIVCQSLNNPQEEWNAHYYDMPSWQQNIESGMWSDLTDYDFTSLYNAATLDTVSYKGKVYALPTAVSAYNGIYYNKSIYAELGLEVPTTWDALIDNMQKIKDAGYDVVTLGMSEREYALEAYVIYSMLGSWFADDIDTVLEGLLKGDIKHTDPEILEFYEALDQFCSFFVENATGVTKSSAIAQFSTGTVAMFAEASWSNGAIAAAVDGDFEFGYFAMPGRTPRADGLIPQFATKTDNSWVLPTNAPNKEGALAFMAWVSQADVYQGFINKVQMNSTLNGVNVESDFLASLAEGMQDVRTHTELSLYKPVGIGIYGDWYGFKMTFVDTMGGIMTVHQLAENAAADFATWQAAMGF